MNIIVFENNQTNLLDPFSINHAPFELRVGGLTNLERIEKLFSNDKIILIVREEIEGIIKDRFNDYLVNPQEIPSGLCLNGAAIFNNEDLSLLDKEKPLSSENNLIAFKLDKSIPKSDFNKELTFALDITLECKIQVIKYLWDLFRFSNQYIKIDFNSFIGNHNYKSHHSLIRLNEDNIHIGNNCNIKAGVILDATNGPIILDDNSIINNGAILEGPIYIGKKSIISSSALIKSNTVIGPMCKIGGEISSCNFLGFSNKVHDGFLGHSYIGEWVNIGAATNNSNLKNNYNNVNIIVDEKNMDTELQFLGSIIGDYSRMAIGTLLNTGSHVSFGVNLFNHDFSLKYIPPFSWGDDKIVELDKFIATIASMKSRRNKLISENEINFIKNLYSKKISK